MTGDELRAAADRLSANGYADHKFVTMPVFSFGKQHDYIALAQAWMREHPADDAEPVTAEWLESQGFRFIEAGPEDPDGYRGPDLWSRFPVTYNPTVDRVAVNGFVVGVVPDRGHVRRLLNALGVPTA